MNATLRHWALLAAFTIPFAFAGLALIDAVLLADEPPTAEGIMAANMDTSANVRGLCNGICMMVSPAMPDSGSPTRSSALRTTTTAGAVLHGD